MKEAVKNDFAKYTHSIKQIYQQRLTKKLFIETGVLGLLLIAFSLITSSAKWLLIGMVLAVWLLEIFRGLKYFRDYAEFLGQLEATWSNQIESIKWESPEWRIYEDENYYYPKKEIATQRIAKKGSRTMPSEIRGISLIVGENAQLFAQEQPIFIVYCDTTEIKHIDLAKRNEATIKQMKLTKFKNKVLRPILYVLIVLLFIWYFTGWL